MRTIIDCCKGKNVSGCCAAEAQETRVGMYITFCICQRAPTGPPIPGSPPVLLRLLRVLSAGLPRDATRIPVSIIPSVLFVCTCKCMGIVFADATAP